jgi:hypothetical protein
VHISRDSQVVVRLPAMCGQRDSLSAIQPAFSFESAMKCAWHRAHAFGDVVDCNDLPSLNDTRQPGCRMVDQTIR